MSGHRARKHTEEVLLEGKVVTVRHLYDLASDTYCAEAAVNGETFLARSKRSYAGARYWLLRSLRDLHDHDRQSGRGV